MIHLKTFKAHLIARINQHLTRPAESPSVERQKTNFAKEAFPPKSIEHPIKRQDVLPARYFILFYFLLLLQCSWASTSLVQGSYSERLLTNTFCNRLLDRPYLSGSSQVPALYSGRSRACSPVTFCENKRKRERGDKVSERTSGESLHFTQLWTSRASSSGTNANAAGFLRRHARWLPKVSRGTHSRSSIIRSSSPARKPDTGWTLLAKWTHVRDRANWSPRSAWLAFPPVREGRSFQARNFTRVTKHTQIPSWPK